MCHAVSEGQSWPLLAIACSTLYRCSPQTLIHKRLEVPLLTLEIFAYLEAHILTASKIFDILLSSNRIDLAFRGHSRQRPQAFAHITSRTDAVNAAYSVFRRLVLDHTLLSHPVVLLER